MAPGSSYGKGEKCEDEGERFRRNMCQMKTTGGLGYTHKKGDITLWLRALGMISFPVSHLKWVLKPEERSKAEEGKNTRQREPCGQRYRGKKQQRASFVRPETPLASPGGKMCGRRWAAERVRGSPPRSLVSLHLDYSATGKDASAMFRQSPFPTISGEVCLTPPVRVRGQYLKSFSFMFLDKEGFATSLTTLKCFLSFRGLKVFLLCSNIIYPSCTQEWKAEIQREKSF